MGIIAADDLRESFWRRAWRDMSHAATQSWFVLVQTALDAATGAVVGLLAHQWSGNAWVAALLGAVAAAAGGVCLSLLVFAATAIRVPFRQRDEARKIVMISAAERSDEVDHVIDGLQSQLATAGRHLNMAELLDEQADRLAVGYVTWELPGVETRQENQRFVAELRLRRLIDVNDGNVARLTDFGTRVVERLRQPRTMG